VAAGVALLGAAALVLVLAQLVRDVETRPYVSIAPVLAVFSGFLLTSLRVKLPLEGLASEHAGMFALALALIGGALVAGETFGGRMLGWSLVLAAPGLLVYVVALPKGQGDLVTALRQLDPQVSMFLGLLSLSSLALGAVARALARLAGRGDYDLEGDLPLRLPRLNNTLPGWDQQQAHNSRMTPQGLTYGNAYASQSGYQGSYAASAYRDEADMAALRGTRVGPLLLIGAIVCLAAFAAVYWFTHRGAPITTAATSPAAGTSPAPVVQPLGAQPATAAVPAPSVDGAAADTPASAKPTTAPIVAPSQALPAPSPAPAAENGKSSRREARAARAEARAARAEARAAKSAAASSAKAKQALEAGPSAKPAKGERARAAKAASSVPTTSAKFAGRAEAAPEPAAPKPAEAAATTAKAPVTESKPSAAKPASNSDDSFDQLINKAVTGTSAIKPKESRTKPAAPTQNERDLDLDQLLQKSLKGTKGVDAKDDPILGL
jgi:hypothetical protein